MRTGCLPWAAPGGDAGGRPCPPGNMALEKGLAMLYAQAMGHETGTLGIMADSHGNNRLLAAAIRLLQSRGARTLIHLGDMCDTRVPHLVEETFRLLEEHGVKGIRGNNECQLAHDLGTSRDPGGLREIRRKLEALPYVIVMDTLLFTHSAPFSYPMATRRPVSEFLPALLGDPGTPFSILFRGHSHRPSVMRITGQSIEKVPFEQDRALALDATARYIVTVGAVEKASSVLFDPGDRVIRFVTVPGS
jgi:predicted phosphodiesterase